MSETSQAELPLQSVFKGFRVWLGVIGAVSLITGVLFLFYPGFSAGVLTTILAIYTLLGGLLYFGTAFSSGISGWARVGYILVGLLFIVAAIVAILNPVDAALTLGVIVATFLGVAWIFEGIATLSSLPQVPGRGWIVFSGIISILAGIALIIAPLLAAAVLFYWIAIILIVLGVIGIVRAFTLGRAVR